MLAIAAVSFIFLFIGAASQLGEIGGVIALVIAFVLTLVGMAPAGDAVSYALRYAWYLAVMPMALMAVFNLFLGLSPVRLLRDALRQRLVAAAGALDGRDEALCELLRADHAALAQQAMFASLLALVGKPAAAQIGRDVRAGYRLMLAAAALPADSAHRESLAAAIGEAIAAIDAGRAPRCPDALPIGAGAAETEIVAALSILAGAPEGEVVPAPKPAFFAADALTNPDHQRFALKTTAAAVICYVIYAGLDWQGIHTAMITCYVAALGTTGETVHKLGLRIAGCLVGATMGAVAVLFVEPQLDSIGGLMAMVFAGVLVGAWVSTGRERISYGGVQIALAFLLTVLQGFGPGTSLDSGWDRVVGILLGNLVVYLIFTRVWPVSVEGAARDHLRASLAALARLAALPPERRAGGVADAALAGLEAGKAGELLALMPYEPLAIRPAEATQAMLCDVSEEIGALTRDIYLNRMALDGTATRLRHLAMRIAGAPQRDDPAAIGGDDTFSHRLDRLQSAVG